jgi:Tfp pilus assembly protein FimT
MTPTYITGTSNRWRVHIRPSGSSTGLFAGDDRGLSLLELIVIMFILSAILMIAMPKFAGLRSGLKDQASHVASVLRFASDMAAARKEERAVKFDFSTHSMSYDQEGSLRTFDLDSLSSVELLSRGEVKEGELVVIFSPEGLGEFMSVHLKKNDASLDVEYNPISRRVSILAPEEEEDKQQEEKKQLEEAHAATRQ